MFITLLYCICIVVFHFVHCVQMKESAVLHVLVTHSIYCCLLNVFKNPKRYNQQIQCNNYSRRVLSKILIDVNVLDNNDTDNKRAPFAC